MINQLIDVPIGYVNTTVATKAGLLPTYMKDPVLYAVALSIIGVGVIMVYITKSVMPVTHFLYSNARIQARSNLLVSDKKLREITEAKSLAELNNLLRETEYAEELEKVNRDNLWGFHGALEKSFVGSVMDLIELSPDRIKPLLNAYLMFLEAKVLKTIYRIKLSKRELDESLVFPVGNITPILLKKLIEAESVADVKVVMENSVYWGVLSKDFKTLEEFEVSLDEFVLGNFVKIARATKMHDSKYVVGIVNIKMDILNLLALLKFKVRNVDAHQALKALVHPQTTLSERLKNLVKTESVKDIVEGCRGLRYYDTLAKALEEYEKDKSLSHFEHELYKYYKKFVLDDELNHSLGPYPLFSYLVKKELERRNLFVITRGIDAGFNAEEIRRLVI